MENFEYGCVYGMFRIYLVFSYGRFFRFMVDLRIEYLA